MSDLHRLFAENLKYDQLCRYLSQRHYDRLKQCSLNADPLFDEFRTDISCQTLRVFRKHGIKLQDLIRLKEKVPVVYPWDLAYNTLRQNVNRRFQIYPLAIVMCTKQKHVVRALRFARKYCLETALRAGSHCFESYSLGPFVIDQSQRQGIRYRNGLVYVRPGALLGPSQYILSQEINTPALIAGTCPNNSVSNVLGGGIGFLIRKYGLTSDSLVNVEMVLANGEVVNANKNEHKDLFWALRGAGNGNFGIATEFTLKPVYIKRVTVFSLIYSCDKVKKIIDTWQRWAPFTINELSSELNVYTNRVLIDGLYLGSEEDLYFLIGDLLALTPNQVNIKSMSFIDSVRAFGSTVWEPFFKNKSAFVHDFIPEVGLQIIEDQMKNRGLQDHLELFAFGGKMNTINSKETAFPFRKGTLIWAHFQCHWNDQLENAENIAWVTNFYDQMEPYMYGAYYNAPDADLINPLQKYFQENLTRLERIKKRYDPDDFFHYGQSIQ